MLLKSEHESALNIDRLMNGKAIEKRKLLQNLFSICARWFDSSEDDVLSMSEIGEDDSENYGDYGFDDLDDLDDIDLSALGF
mgnify:CR=1 FL=1